MKIVAIKVKNDWFAAETVINEEFHNKLKIKIGKVRRKTHEMILRRYCRGYKG